MWSLLLACQPYRPPAEIPALERAQAVRRVEVAGPPRVAIRAGSAFDPPGREGLAWTAARVMAGRVGAEVRVGREIVELELRQGVDPLARIWGEPVSEAEVVAVAVAPERSCLEQAEDAYAVWAWAGHPYGHPVWGRRSTLPTITAAEVQNFVGRWWVRDAIASTVEAPALRLAPARLVRAPVPTFLPSPPAEAQLEIRGAGSCVAFGGGPVADAAEYWSALGDPRPFPAQSDALWAVARELPTPTRAVELRPRLRELWSTGPPARSWAEVLLPPRRDPVTTPGPLEWLAEAQLRALVVLPDGEYADAEGVPLYAEIVR